jgi:hypothetical protein
VIFAFWHGKDLLCHAAAAESCPDSHARTWCRPSEPQNIPADSQPPSGFDLSLTPSGPLGHFSSITSGPDGEFNRDCGKACAKLFFCIPNLQSNLQKQRIAHGMTIVATLSKQIAYCHFFGFSQNQLKMIPEMACPAGVFHRSASRYPVL